MPKVSVIMPVYNTDEHFLRPAISSILNQTFKDFEFIIINDGSTNNAEDVILSYKDKRIKYHKNKTNLKIIKTLNKGLNLAKGEYIARMDSDDISFRTRFEKQVEFLDSHPKIGLLNAYAIQIPSRTKIQPPINSNDIQLFLKYDANCIIHPLVMFRHDILKQNNLSYSEDFLHVEDYKLWLDMLNYTNFYTLPTQLLLLRIHSNQVSKQNLKLQVQHAAFLVCSAVLEDLGIKDKKYKTLFHVGITGGNISIEDYIELEYILTLAMNRITNCTDYVFRARTIQNLHAMKLKLFSSVI